MIRVAALSLQGKRTSNQDRTLIAPAGYGSGMILAAVADGLGGMQAGDQAAEIAVETLKEEANDLLLRMSGDLGDARRSLIEAYQLSNERIRAYAQAHAQLGAVGTTLVTLIVSGSRYMVINSGDSRCYRVDHAAVSQITNDHTVADSLLRHGVMTAQDHASSPLRNQLTRCLGPKADCEPELFPEDEFGAIDHDCTFLLCSDGFYFKLTPADLAQLDGSSLQLEDVLANLAAVALERGSSDNLSAVAVRFETSV
jgi:protein phosphatase